MMSEGYIVSVWPDLFRWVPTIAEGVDLALDHIKKEDNDRTRVGYYVRNFEIKYDEVGEEVVSLRVKRLSHEVYDVVDVELSFWISSKTSSRDLLEEVNNALGAM